MSRPIQMISFTAGGAALLRRLLDVMADTAEGCAPARYCGDDPRLSVLSRPVGQWAAERFRAAQALVFIGAAGIAIRAVAPLVRDKKTDPAVLCIDEEGRYVIALLSGHIGGANRLATGMAKILGAVPVITTATDVRGVFSPDDWAAHSGCAVPDPAQIRAVSAALLDGNEVGFYSEFPVEGELPKGLSLREDTDFGIVISLQEQKRFPHTLWLMPKIYRVGIGCRRGVPDEAVENAVASVFRIHGFSTEAIGAVASIELKSNEEALLNFCMRRRIPLQFYTADQLMQVAGSDAFSVFVQQITGADNICERAALAQGGDLLVEKTAVDGVTVAVVKQEWRALF